MKRALDVSHLPHYTFGSRAVSWWGMLGMIAAEATMFALLMSAYLYLSPRNATWPAGAFPPALLFGTVNTLILLASVLPNHLMKRKAEALDLHGTRRWLIVGCLFSAAFCVVRVFEFRALNIWWDDNAYGSIVWTLLGFHTAHLVTDVFDTVVLTVLLFTGPIEEKHFVDASENSIYWDFVVLAWLPIYGLIYLFPRFS